MKPISIQSLIEVISQSDIKKDRYIVTYPAYVHYFSNLQEVSNYDIFRGVGFVYSWMPRVISISDFEVEAFISCIKEYKNSSNKSLDENLINAAVRLTQESIVAASKLLHFLFPNDFPIYDSHVFRYCWERKVAYHYQINSKSNYHTYKKLLRDMSSEEAVGELVRVVSEKSGYKVSKLRALEFSIFHMSKSKCA